MKQADAILKGMEINNTKIDNTIISPFYNNNQNSVNPFIPVFMPQNNFSGGNRKSEITRKNPMGDLKWLIGK